jgi:hypothetical protein
VEHVGFEMNSKIALLGGGVALLLMGALAGYLYGVNSTPTKTTTAMSTTTVTLTTTLAPVSTSLGWQPVHSALIPDIEQSHYFND